MNDSGEYDLKPLLVFFPPGSQIDDFLFDFSIDDFCFLFPRLLELSIYCQLILPDFENDSDGFDSDSPFVFLRWTS